MHALFSLLLFVRKKTRGTVLNEKVSSTSRMQHISLLDCNISHFSARAFVPMRFVRYLSFAGSVHQSLNFILAHLALCGCGFILEGACTASTRYRS